jgi:microcystin-dependent protein
VSDPFVAEIRMFPFYFPPTGWAFCDGQLMPISQNTALFSLLGTTYGGDGKSTFALPDLQGSAGMHAGQGSGLADRFLGEQSGSDSVTLLISEIPVHTHSIQASARPAIENDAAGLYWATSSLNMYTPAGGPGVAMAFQTAAPAGGGLPHNNMMPYLTVNFCIAMQGIFPQRP